MVLLLADENFPLSGFFMLREIGHDIKDREKYNDISAV